MIKKFLKYISLFIKGWIGTVLISLLLATSFKSAIADWYVVPTGSMKPTILIGDRIFTNKLAYDLKIPFSNFHIATWDNPERGDVVVFNSPISDKSFVKRVIGIPGDVISMKNNHIFVNGEKLKYDIFHPDSFNSLQDNQGPIKNIYIEDLTGHKHKTMFIPHRASIRSFEPITVPKGQYFMMGDNRDNSADSRFFGFIDRKEILGQAISIVISLDLGNHYKPRWSRFFTKLQ